MRRVSRVAVACVLCLLGCWATTSHAQDPVAPDAGAPDAAAPPPPAAEASPESEAPQPEAAPAPPEIVDDSPVPAAPPEQENTGVSEIVVTAQRRKTNLQQTPISITAVTAETLRARGAVDLEGVAEATPNMQLTTSGNGSGGSSFAQVFIRGVGQPDFIITKDPAVGIYVDGVYLARAPGALLELLDIERVEVLRGPQGTLFGKNTAGGAISVITKQPEGAWTDKVSKMAM